MDEHMKRGFEEAKRINRKAGKPTVRYSTIYHMLIPWWHEYDDDDLGIMEDRWIKSNEIDEDSVVEAFAARHGGREPDSYEFMQFLAEGWD